MLIRAWDQYLWLDIVRFLRWTLDIFMNEVVEQIHGRRLWFDEHHQVEGDQQVDEDHLIEGDEVTDDEVTDDELVLLMEEIQRLGKQLDLHLMSVEQRW